MFKHILVPTDGSQLSRDAANRAVVFAKSVGARITAFYAKQPYHEPYYGEYIAVDLPPPSYFEELAEKEAQEILGFVENICQENGVDCSKLTVTSDNIYLDIIAAATRNDCDLIFMASHGRHGFSALLLGSVTNKVLTHTKIPVLVYR